MSFFSHLFKKSDGSQTLFGKAVSLITHTKQNQETSEPRTIWQILGISDHPFQTTDGQPIVDLSKSVKLPQVNAKATIDKSVWFGLGGLLILFAILTRKKKP